MDAPLSPNFRHLTGKTPIKGAAPAAPAQYIKCPRNPTHESVAIISAGVSGRAHAVTGVPAEEMVIFEQAGGFGGVWYTKTYSGAACDIASHI